MSTSTTPVLQVRDLTVNFTGVPAVAGVTFDLRPGQCVGLVGESGSGKSATAMSIMGLMGSARVEGQVRLDGTDLFGLSPREMNKIRGGRIAMIYQDPMSSLNPVMTVGSQIVEAIRLHSTQSRRAARARAVELLDRVGITRPEQRVKQYPHEFSGGMRQRVMIAMALAGDPQVLIADEPTTALDVTTQARILDLLKDLSVDNDTAILLITHDLAVAAGACDEIHVMRSGRILESAPSAQLFTAPRHDYTRRLLSAVVDLTTDVDRSIVLGDDTEPASAPATTPAPQREDAR